MNLISVGANLDSPFGAPMHTIRAAISAIAKRNVLIRAISRFYATPCFPKGAGPDYVNAALNVEWGGSPQGLLAILHDVEFAFARQREQRWGMRTLDLDLIAQGNAVCPDAEVHKRWRNLPMGQQMQEAPDQLILPHPRVQDRAFVLVPLMDIAPDWTHPILGVDVATMCAALPEEERNSVKPM